MSKRTVRQWASKQYAGDVQPWLRLSIIAGVLVVILLKLVGLL